MNRYVVSYRWQLLGLSLTVLLALMFLLFVQVPVPLLEGLTIRADVADGDMESGSMAADPVTGAHPADRKFFGNTYVNSRDPDIYSMSGVHPADRKFFTSGYGMSGRLEVSDPQLAVSGAETPLEEAIIGNWKFPVDGYYIGFDEEGRLCYGGSAETVTAKRWCNKYIFEDGIVNETCMGGPEDRNCPLGGGSCKARVDIGEDGQLRYQLLHDECNMMQYKVVPPRQHSFTKH